MKRFAALLDTLQLTPSRNRKIQLIADYVRQTPDPDRGYGIAAITRDLEIKVVQPAMLRGMLATRVDEELFRLSHDYVGDLAETISLLWVPVDGSEAKSCNGETPDLATIVARLQRTSRTEVEATVSELLDPMTPSERYALIKLATGALRVGVSAQLAKQALAVYGGVDVDEVQELWHGLAPPYIELFAWLEGRGDKPVSTAAAPFRAVMLSHPLEARDHSGIDPETFAAEWKWDGIRVQLVNDGGVKKLYSRTGEDISAAFRDLLEAPIGSGAFDGELLVRSPLGDVLAVRTFSDLQQRLNRKTVSANLMASHPGFIRFYDMLFTGGCDLRALPLAARRARLEAAAREWDPARFDISPTLAFSTFDDLVRLRAEPPHPVIEGLMLKRWSAAYVGGRPRGLWYKWKRDPMIVDAVMMYAQRGRGKRSGFHSDFTFGVWTDAGSGEAEMLVPVGKAYFGFTDAELKQLDAFVRENTVDRFGPVRAVTATPDEGLVLEIAFEGLNRSTRHKSGVAMRFPRISRIRWDKKPSDADRLTALTALLG